MTELHNPDQVALRASFTLPTGLTTAASTDTLDRTLRVLREHLGVEEMRLRPTAKLIDDLDADSLDVVEIVMSVEEEFNIEIPDEAAEKLSTVQEIFTYITTRL